MPRATTVNKIRSVIRRRDDENFDECFQKLASAFILKPIVHNAFLFCSGSENTRDFALRTLHIPLLLIR